MTSSRENDTPVRVWLARQPGRCPGCGGHLPTQGHAPNCLFGPRAAFSFQPDGTWRHNGGPVRQSRPGEPYGKPILDPAAASPALRPPVR